MRKFFFIILSVILIAGCVPLRAGEPSPASALGQVLGYILVSPALILIGLVEGISSAPYYVSGDIHAMNAEMEAADANVTLDQTYQYAYNRPLRDGAQERGHG